MKAGDKSNRLPKRTFWQWTFAVLLVTLPVLMIFFNSSRALNAIFWKAPAGITLISDSNQRDWSPKQLRKKAPDFGIYDHGRKFEKDSCFSMEQVYISWIEPDASSVRLHISRIIAAGRSPVVTIEPWNKGADAKSLLKDIIAGKYDPEIEKVIGILSGFNDTLYISWGHEMDQDLTERYPWSGQEHGDYVSAYRYMHDKIKRGLKTETRWIWAPVAKQGCERYWPGENYVDLVGLPIYSYPAWEKSYYGHLRKFSSWYEEKYKLVEQFHKPVMIVELGVTGSPDYQTLWLQDAFESLKSLPSIEAVIFFHATDTRGSWGENIATPDWQTDPQVITGLIDWIKNEY